MLHVDHMVIITHIFKVKLILDFRKLSNLKVRLVDFPDFSVVSVRWILIGLGKSGGDFTGL